VSLFKSCEWNNANFICKADTLLYRSLTSQHFPCSLQWSFKCPQTSIKKARSHTNLHLKNDWWIVLFQQGKLWPFLIVTGSSQPWILSHTFNSYFVTAQHCNALWALSLNFFSKKNNSQYRIIIFRRSQHTDTVYWANQQLDSQLQTESQLSHKQKYLKQNTIGIGSFCVMHQ